MSLENYGILKGKPKDCKMGKGKSSHYQILVHDGRYEHRVAVNVNSKVPPSDLLYFVDDNFSHEMTEKLDHLDMGFKRLDNTSRNIKLDYVRGGLFDTSKMVPLKSDIPGPSNDLNELIEKYVKKASGMAGGMIYAFGERWGPESFLPDSFFGFRPGSGIHDVHMNQGNSKKWKSDDAPYQDGGLLIHMSEENRWVAIFLAFQSQCFNTDDLTGHCISSASHESLEEEVISKTIVPPGSVKIIGALVDPEGVDAGKEAITIFNASSEDIDLDGWYICDGPGRKSLLKGEISSGSGVCLRLSGKGVILSNRGGQIKLYDDNDRLLHEVRYSGRQVRSGWTIIF